MFVFGLGAEYIILCAYRCHVTFCNKTIGYYVNK